MTERNDLRQLKEELKKIIIAVQTQESLKGVMPDDLLRGILDNLHSQRENLERRIAELKKVRQTGDIHADTIQAENVVSGVQININQKDDSLSAGEEELYLRTLMEKCEVLDLAAVDESCSPEDAVRVSDVFTSLNLTQQRFPSQTIADVLCGKIKEKTERSSSEEPIPIPAIEAAGQMCRLVILGKPGGGKSTLVNYICSALARSRLENGQNCLPGFPPEESPLPVRIILRHFAEWIPASIRKGCAALVWNYLKDMLEKNWGSRFYEKLRCLLQEKGGIIFFDGLDEVRESDEDAKRSVITASVRQFSKPLDKCRIVITCREYAYKKTDGWRLPEKEFPVAELALFDEDQIRSFSQIWYQVIGPRNEWDETRQENEARSLFDGIQAQPHLQEIAQYPLLLTLMAKVHGRDGTLPKDRADLYRRAVHLLLEHWDNRVVREDGQCKRESGLILRLGIRRDMLLNVLERLAFDAHERQEKEKRSDRLCADISRLDLLEAFQKECKSLDKAETIISYIRERAGLLTAQDNRTYTFPHRTFQEYLAASWIMKQAEFDSILAERIRRDLNWWREVFLLAAGYSKNVPRNISNMIEMLLEDDPPDKKVGSEQAAYARLSAQSLTETDFAEHAETEIKNNRAGRFSKILRRIQQWLVHAIESDESLEATERAECGRSLAVLGDPRKEIMTLTHMQFCLIPAGDFYMGDGDKQHLNKCLNYPYWMSHHPVTNAQYEAFVQAGGYAQAEYWKEAEEAGYWKSGAYKGGGDSMPRGRPADYGFPYHLSNHPVVGISWYEALAFCRWLTDFWREQGILNDRWQIRLPSEAEWEKAARGGVDIPENPLILPASAKGWDTAEYGKREKNTVRTYPWGEEADKNKANYNDTGIGSTSVAGCFCSGISPFGCLDMAGNVGEWTRSLVENEKKEEYEYPYDPEDGRENTNVKQDIFRILRGGSCFDHSAYVRYAVRYGSNPFYRYFDRGFRCVCTPDWNSEI